MSEHKRGSQLHPKDIQKCFCLTNFPVPHWHMIHFTECFRKAEIILWKTSAFSSITYPVLNIRNTTLNYVSVRYSPGCSHHRQRDGQANAQTGPHERRSLCQEPAEKEVQPMKTALQTCSVQNSGQMAWISVCLFWLVSDANRSACCTFYKHLADGW